MFIVICVQRTTINSHTIAIFEKYYNYFESSRNILLVYSSGTLLLELIDENWFIRYIFTRLALELIIFSFRWVDEHLNALVRFN